MFFRKCLKLRLFPDLDVPDEFVPAGYRVYLHKYAKVVIVKILVKYHKFYVINGIVVYPRAGFFINYRG